MKEPIVVRNQLDNKIIGCFPNNPISKLRAKKFVQIRNKNSTTNLLVLEG